MSTFFLAPALVELRSEVDAKYPNRDHASDGWIGDPSHAARVSDHNPCWTCPGRLNGIVRAIDIDISPDGRADADIRSDVLKTTIGDHRVWYVISNGKIYSRTFGWAARAYTGTNGHFEHVHVSLAHAVAEFDTSRWFDKNKPLPRKTIDLSVVKEQMLIALGEEKGRVRYAHSIRFVQLALNKKHNAGLTTDGLAGSATLNAWGRHEGNDGKGRPRIPDGQSLSRLVAGTRLDWNQ